MEPGDDEAPILWAYLIADLRTVHPKLLPGVDDVLCTTGMDPMRRIVLSLVNEISEIDEPMVLVLDDYHV